MLYAVQIQVPSMTCTQTYNVLEKKEARKKVATEDLNEKGDS